MLENTLPFYTVAAEALTWPPEPGADPRKVFVIDDDPGFCRHVRRLGARRGIEVVCFHPDLDFARLPLDGEFDAGIVDYDLGELTGTQLSALYQETPLILISGRARVENEADPWPGSVRQFVHKLQGADMILRVALGWR